MKTLIVYQSYHHQNTKKLVDAICEKHEVQAVTVAQASHLDLNGYDIIGLASGIAYGKFYAQMEQFAQVQLPEKKNIFLLYTCGKDTGHYTDSITKIANMHHCTVLGVYGCLGFDTYGPLKLIGGIAKGHPTTQETDAAVTFYEHIVNG